LLAPTQQLKVSPGRATRVSNSKIIIMPRPLANSGFNAVIKRERNIFSTTLPFWITEGRSGWGFGFSDLGVSSRLPVNAPTFTASTSQ
jgi:hypothetical protein